MPKRKTEELGSLSKSEKLSLNRLYFRGRAAYGSLRNLGKSSRLSKKMRTTFTNQDIVYYIWSYNQTFPKASSYSKYINEIWCIDLALGDKLLRQDKGVKYLFVAVEVFSLFVRVQKMKTKYAKDTLQASKN